MAKKEKPIVCPSCGEPVRPGFLQIKLSEKAKTVLALLIVGYVVLSGFLLRLSIPPEMKRRSWTEHPDNLTRLIDSLSLSLSNTPVIPIIAGSGLIVGLGIFYWDYFQEIYENWKKKHGKENKHKCRSCGWEW